MQEQLKAMVAGARWRVRSFGHTRRSELGGLESALEGVPLAPIHASLPKCNSSRRSVENCHSMSQLHVWRGAARGWPGLSGDMAFDHGSRGEASIGNVRPMPTSPHQSRRRQPTVHGVRRVAPTAMDSSVHLFCTQRINGGFWDEGCLPQRCRWSSPPPDAADRQGTSWLSFLNFFVFFLQAGSPSSNPSGPLTGGGMFSRSALSRVMLRRARNIVAGPTDVTVAVHEL